MAKDNVPENSTVLVLSKQVSEMQSQLDEAIKRTSGLTWNNRNWEAVKQTLEKQESRFADLKIQIDSVKNLVMVLQQQYQQFQQQRAIELNNLLSNRQTVRDE